MTCQARQYSDQMHCSRCGLQWDVNDDDPPRCAPPTQPVTPAEWVEKIKQQLDD